MSLLVGGVLGPSVQVMSTATPPTEIYTLSLHDALPISDFPRATRRRSRSSATRPRTCAATIRPSSPARRYRSEEHTSELQSRRDLVCRLLLEKKNVEDRR